MQPEPPGWLEPSTLIAIASALIALLALYFSSSSARTARKALQLAREQDDRKHPLIRAELADAFVALEVDGRRYWITTTIINRSEAPNSIVQSELRVWTRAEANSNEEPTKLNLPASWSAPLDSAFNQIELPYRLEGNSATSGTFEFYLKNVVLNGRHVLGIDLLIRDTQGRLEVVHDIFPREVAK